MVLGCYAFWQLAWSWWCFGVASVARVGCVVFLLALSLLLVFVGFVSSFWPCWWCVLLLCVWFFLVGFLCWLVILVGASLGVFCGVLCVWLVFFALFVCRCFILLVLFLFAPISCGEFEHLLIYKKKKK